MIVPNHFGAAVSSSPSNTPPPFEKGRFPRMTTYDNIAAQHRLVTEELGIERLRLVSSWSMGAAQTYAWAAMHPEMVRRGRADLRLRAHRALQQGLPRGPAPRDHVRPATSTTASTRTSRRSAASGRSPRSTPAGAFSEPFFREEVFRVLRRRRRRGVHRRSSGTPSTSSATPTTCSRRSGRGGTTTSATTRTSAATSRRRSAPSPARTIILNADDGPVLPARRQRLRGGAHPERRVAPDPDDLGPHGAVQPRGPAVHRRAR